jgi:hypothetical protein
MNTALFVPQYIFIAPGKTRNETGPAHDIGRPEIAAKIKFY